MNKRTPPKKLLQGQKTSLEKRLEKHPYLRKRFEAMLDIVESELGVLDDASEAEERIIEEVRKIGQGSLQGWAQQKHDQVAREERESVEKVYAHAKKK